MRFKLSQFYRMSIESPLLIGGFKRVDVNNNHIYTMLQNREGEITSFQFLNTESLIPCNSKSIIPATSFSRQFQVGEKGVLPIYFSSSDSIRVFDWDKVLENWQMESAEYSDTFIDYQIKKIFFPIKTVHQIFPSKSESLPYWRKAQYSYSRAQDKIWDQATTQKRQKTISGLDQRHILKKFDSKFEMLQYLDKADIYDANTKPTWIIVFKHLWERHYETEMLDQIASDALSKLDLDDSLFIRILDIMGERLMKMPDAFGEVLDELSYQKSKTSRNYSYSDLESRNRQYIDTKNRLHILFKLVSLRFSSGYFSLPQTLNRDPDENDLVSVLVFFNESISDTKLPVDLNPNDSDSVKLVQRIAIELPNLVSHPNLFLRTIYYLFELIDSLNFEDPINLHLSNFIRVQIPQKFALISVTNTKYDGITLPKFKYEFGR